MSPRTRISGGLAAVVAVAMLALAGAAGAAPKPPHAGERTFQQTFPHASRVCTEVAAGGGLKRLRPFAPQVAADCATLQTQFNTAHATVLAQFAAIAAARAAQRAATTVACPTRHPHTVACGLARKQQHLIGVSLFHQHEAAAKTYWKAVEAARHAFWVAIRALPGGHALHSDKPIPQLNS